DRGIHQALSNAADKARQLTKTVQESLRGQAPVLGPRPERLATLMTQPVHALRVREVMSHHVRSCSADDSLAHAMRSMLEAQVRRLPVVDAEGRLVGILSLGDVIRAATLLGQKEAEAVVFQLLLAVSQRRPQGQ